MSRKDHRSQGKYIIPRIDSGFKILFGTEDTKDILIGFLNDLLEINETDPIEDIEFIDKEKPATKNIERESIYDIHCKTTCNKRFIVEMQNFPQPYFLDRSIFYAARAICEQAKRGKWPYSYMPVYGVFICDFAIPGNEGEVRIDADIRIKKSKKPLTDKLNLIYVQLSEFKKKNPEACVNDFERWVYLLKYLETMSTIPFAGMKEAFRRVENVGRVENLKGDDLVRYEHDLKAYRDYHAQLLYASTEGLNQGITKGMAKGIEEGMAKGMAKGMAQGKAEIIRTLIDSGLTISEIAVRLRISQSDIENLLSITPPLNN